MVLLFDSDDRFRGLVQRVLEERGLGVWAPADDLTAYQVIHQEGAHLSVLVADLASDIKAAAALVARARCFNPDIAVIYCVTRRVRAPPADGVVCRKPVDPEVLGGLVERMAERARRARGLRPGTAPMHEHGAVRSRLAP